MEGFNITPNAFEYSKESRMEVVKKVCEVILDYVNAEDSDYDKMIHIRGEHPALYLAEVKRENSGYIKKTITTVTDKKDAYNYTRIRTCEMRKVFGLLQDAGYYIFEGNWEYQISKRPYLGDKKAQRTEFKFFID